ncbi:MAG: hypothetical protein WD557_17685 [Dehalococcoidia bacterium]
MKSQRRNRVQKGSSSLGSQTARPIQLTTTEAEFLRLFEDWERGPLLRAVKRSGSSTPQQIRKFQEWANFHRDQAVGTVLLLAAADSRVDVSRDPLVVTAGASNRLPSVEIDFSVPELTPSEVRKVRTAVLAGTPRPIHAVEMQKAMNTAAAGKQSEAILRLVMSGHRSVRVEKEQIVLDPAEPEDACFDENGDLLPAPR